MKVLWFFQDAILDPFLKNASITREAFHETTSVLVAIVAAKTLFEMMTLVLQGVLRGLGRTSDVCRVQAIASFLVWIPAYCLIRISHPTVPAYWLTMIFSGVASCVLLGRCVRRRHIIR